LKSIKRLAISRSRACVDNRECVQNRTLCRAGPANPSASFGFYNHAHASRLTRDWNRELLLKLIQEEVMFI
jgi:hypothetical protein